MAIARTYIIRIELVNAYERTGGGEPEEPGHERAPDRELAFMQVVGEDGVELHIISYHIISSQRKRSRVSQRQRDRNRHGERGAGAGSGNRNIETASPTHPDVRMDDEREREDAVEDGVRARAGRDRRAEQGDEARAEQTFKRPVVRAMRAGRRGERGRVVNRALVDCYCRSWPGQPGSSSISATGGTASVVREEGGGRWKNTYGHRGHIWGSRRRRPYVLQLSSPPSSSSHSSTPVPS